MSLYVVRSLVFGGLAFAALFAGFRWNVWHSAGEASFAAGQKDTEGLVIGRLAASRTIGIFGMGGLLGFVGDCPELVTSDTAVLWRSYDPNAQTRIYLAQAPFRSFGPYLSHSGLQGNAFALLDRVLGFLAPSTRLDLFFSLTAALVAAVYTALLVFLQREFGACAALLAFAAVLASPWLTIFGRNLYLSLWIFWLPAFAIGVVLARWAGRRQEGPWLALAAFLGFLARFLSGYEYITESVALAAAPILYYSLRDAVGVGVFLKRAVIATGASALALALSLGILTLQIGQVTGSSGDAWKHIEFAIARRIRGDRSQLPPVYSSSLQAETNAVLAFYLVDAFDREAQEKPPALRWLLGRRHIDLIALVLAAALWVAVRAAWLPAERRSRALGLVAATAGTLAGVLAWLIVFKAHSFIHWHVNPLLWHLGFFQLGAALVGLAVADALRLIAVTARPPASQRGS